MTTAGAELTPAAAWDVRTIRADWLAPVVVVAAVFAVATLIARPYAVGVFHDDGVYVILAKSLATAQGYRYLHLPGAPAAVHYPPGYPLLLAELWRLAPDFPANIAVFLAANAVFLATIAGSVIAFARRVLGWRMLPSVVAAMFATLSLPLLMLSRLVLSETMFVALLVPTLIGAERLVREPSNRRAVAIGVAAGVVMLVRMHGAALPLALVVLLAVQRRWREALLSLAGTALMLAPWELWQLAHAAHFAETLRGSYGSYGAWLADGLRGGVTFVTGTVVSNVREIGALLADRFSLTDGSQGRTVGAGLGATIVVIGAAHMARRSPVTVLFAAIYLIVVLLWPYTPWRFVFALWPLLVLSIGDAALWAFDAGRRHAVYSSVALALILLLAVGAVRNEYRAYAQRAWAAPGNAATMQIAPLVRWVATNTRPADVVAADGEQIVYLFTGRRSVPLAPFTAAEYVRPRTVAQNAASIRRLLVDVPVTVVATISPNLYEAARLAARTDSIGSHLTPVTTLSGGGVFRVQKR